MTRLIPALLAFLAAALLAVGLSTSSWKTFSLTAPSMNLEANGGYGLSSTKLCTLRPRRACESESYSTTITRVEKLLFLLRTIRRAGILKKATFPSEDQARQRPGELEAVTKKLDMLKRIRLYGWLIRILGLAMILCLASGGYLVVVAVRRNLRLAGIARTLAVFLPLSMTAGILILMLLFLGSLEPEKLLQIEGFESVLGKMSFSLRIGYSSVICFIGIGLAAASGLMAVPLTRRSRETPAIKPDHDPDGLEEPLYAETVESKDRPDRKEGIEGGSRSAIQSRSMEASVDKPPTPALPAARRTATTSETVDALLTADSAQKAARALGLYLDLIEHSPEQVLPSYVEKATVRAARLTEDAGMEASLCRRFIQNHPTDPEARSLALNAARLCREKLDDEEGAAEIEKLLLNLPDA